MHTLQIEGIDSSFEVVHFSGEEALSHLYRFDVTLRSKDRSVDAELAFDGVVGRPAVLVVRVLGDVRFVHGMVGRLEQGGELDGLASYRVTLVPRAARLARGRNSRVFQKLSVPDIVRTVLEASTSAPIAHRFALEGAYPSRDYCVQYRESDWDFVSRLLEDEGIAYRFEHEEGAHVLVVEDGDRAGEAGPTLRYARVASGAAAAYVSSFTYAEEAHAGHVTLRDYDFVRPRFRLESADRAGRDGDIEHYDGGGYLRAGDARLAKTRLEEHEALRQGGRGKSNAVRVVPGDVFSLAEHARSGFNRAYLVTRVHHEGGFVAGEEVTYENQFEVLVAAVPFRPARVTRRPAVRGVQTAVVVGPPGEEIHTDEHGRVRVQFHWDRLGTNDDHSSCWIRVGQIAAGAGWGAVFTPRVGQEVIVDFIEGDPDQPLVTGVVYHGANRPPYALPADKTKSGYRSQSSPGGDGSNELTFEDRKGSEEVYLHAQKHLQIDVEDDKDQKVHGDETLHVNGTRTVTVDLLHTETVGGAQIVTIGAAQTVTVAAAKAETIGAALALTVGAAKVETVGLVSTEIVGASKSTTVGLSQKTRAGKDISTRAGRNMTLAAKKALSAQAGANADLGAGENLTLSSGASTKIESGDGLVVSVKKDAEVNVGGNLHEETKGKRSIVVEEAITLHCGKSVVTVEKSGKVTVEGEDIEVTSKGPVKVNGKEVHVKSDGPVSVDASGQVKIKGGVVEMN